MNNNTLRQELPPPEPPPPQKPSPPEHTLSMKEQQNIEHQIQCYINAAKENEVIKHANNVVYYRDLEATFGVFGTVEQDEDYLQQELTKRKPKH